MGSGSRQAVAQAAFKACSFGAVSLAFLFHSLFSRRFSAELDGDIEGLMRWCSMSVSSWCTTERGWWVLGVR